MLKHALWWLAYWLVLVVGYLVAMLTLLLGRATQGLTSLCDRAEINLVLARVARRIGRKVRADRRAGR